MVGWFVIGFFVGWAIVEVAISVHEDRRDSLMPRPARPDYRLIWDLEEELGFVHLTMDRRPAPTWTQSASREQKDWYAKYKVDLEMLSEVDRQMRTRSGERGFL